MYTVITLESCFQTCQTSSSTISHCQQHRSNNAIPTFSSTPQFNGICVNGILCTYMYMYIQEYIIEREGEYRTSV